MCLKMRVSTTASVLNCHFNRLGLFNNASIFFLTINLHARFRSTYLIILLEELIKIASSNFNQIFLNVW